MSIYNCKPEWPICLFDFTFKNKCPTYFCFRVKKPLSDYVVEDYFFAAPLKPGKVLFRPCSEEDSSDELLIERNAHLCTCKEFTSNFKQRFIANDPGLFDNSILNSFFEDDLTIDETLLHFQHSVKEPLSDEILDANQDYNQLRKSCLLESEMGFDESQQQSEEDDFAGPLYGSNMMSSMERAVRMTIMGGGRSQRTPSSEEEESKEPAAADSAFNFDLPTMGRRATHVVSAYDKLPDNK